MTSPTPLTPTRPALTPVVIIGELNVDLIMSGVARWPALGAEVSVDGFTMTLGSSSAICAAGLARLRAAGVVHRPDRRGRVGRLLRRGAAIGACRRLRRDSRSRRAHGCHGVADIARGRGLVTYPGASAALTPGAAGRPDLFGDGDGNGSSSDGSGGRPQRRPTAAAPTAAAAAAVAAGICMSLVVLRSRPACAMDGPRWLSARMRRAWTVSFDSGCDPDDAWRE